MAGVWESKTGKKCVVRINGNDVEVDADQPFAQTIKSMAGAKGLAKFTVRADGSEIKSTNMPKDFTGLKLVEIRKYDEAA